MEKIFCLKRYRRWGPRLDSASERAVIEEMLSQSFNRHLFSENCVDALVRIARSSENFRLRAPHGGEAWRILRGHLGLEDK